MSDAADFLKYVINEDIYLIDTFSDAVENTAEVEELKPAIQEDVSEPTEELKKVVVPSNEILVVYDNVIADEMLQTELNYLGKILGAIGKSTDLIDSLNVASSKPNHQGYKYVLCFTPNHKLPIPISTIQYEKVNFEGAQVVIADSLTNISGSTDLRKKLWGVLQGMFLG